MTQTRQVPLADGLDSRWPGFALTWAGLAQTPFWDDYYVFYNRLHSFRNPNLSKSPEIALRMAMAVMSPLLLAGLLEGLAYVRERRQANGHMPGNWWLHGGSCGNSILNRALVIR